MRTDKTLSIIVPIYNESPHLERIVDFFMTTSCLVKRQWIFVNDGSNDESSSILKKLSEKYSFILVEYIHNRGKGYAVREGIKSATGDYIMVQDADFEYDPNDLVTLLEPLLQNKVDVVYGSRFKENAPQVHRTFHYFVNKFLTILSNLLSGIYLTDMETCYKIFKADLLKSMNLQSERFGIEVELTAYIAKISARVYELPISYHPRTHLQGKKITWKDGFAALYHLVYFNLIVDKDEAFNIDKTNVV